MREICGKHPFIANYNSNAKEKITKTSFYSELQFKRERKDNKDSYLFGYLLYLSYRFHLIVVVALILMTNIYSEPWEKIKNKT